MGAGASEAGTEGWTDRHTSSAVSAPPTFMFLSLPWVALRGSGSHPRVILAMSGDICGCHDWGE